jgi:hypothetical protein
LAVEPKIFAKFDLSTLNQVSLLPVDVVRFLTTAFSRERDCYVYNGSRRLIISDIDRENLLGTHHSDYNRLTVNSEKRMHWERVHGKRGRDKFGPYEEKQDANTYPAIRFYNRVEEKVELVRPISYYSHPYYTSDINYTFNPDFIDRHNQFRQGYRDVCVDALNCLSGRYARLFFAYLSADKYEFHFSAAKLRQLLNIEDKYRKASSVKLIFESVKEELKKIGIDFDYAWCTQEEWEDYKKTLDSSGSGEVTNSSDGGKAGKTKTRKKNKKNKSRVRNFWFRAKGMDRYRVPKGEKSVYSIDAAGNPQYRKVRIFFNRDLKMTDNYICENWEYIKRYVDEWGAEVLIDFAGKKMKEMAKQKKKPDNPKAVLLSLIRNRVKELDAEGRGQPALYNEASPKSPETSIPYDGRFDGKSNSEIAEMIAAEAEMLAAKFDSS